MDTNRIALQLYTVREKAGQDLEATLRQVAGIGYRAVELAGFYGRTAAELRSLLDAYGLKAASAHVGLAAFAADPAQVFADMHTLGCEYAIMPFLPEDQRRTRAQFEQLAATLNRLGGLAQAENIKFGYHNHAFEFAPVEGTSLWEVLLEQTDPARVILELDLYWVSFAGVDALELLKQHPGRFPLLHMKDMADSPAREDLPVGEGVLPWKEILGQAKSTNTAWYIAEMDNPRDAFEDVKTSFQSLQQL
ncbi:MAG: Xylose isomerase domain protein barrel [Chloroflexi bacterium]|jgi:sugar phosphate isomerase/epimerase|nr:Xylose isomerase domain protein barrel [Chloroflexota bacterium]